MNNNRVTRLSILREELDQIAARAYPDKSWPLIQSWIAKATPVIRRDWPDFFDDFQRVATKPKGSGIWRMNSDLTISEQEHRRQWKISDEQTREIKQNVVNFLDGIISLEPQSDSGSVVDRVLFLSKRFSILAQQLKIRERGKSPLEIEDEYDVQYLFLALLRLHFDDVRKEIWTPHYAGGSSRMDFLLKREKVVLETKKTRDTLSRDSQVGNELIIDIERYAQYPDCQTLICFVYDPDNLLDNPKGLEQDLSGMRENINVIVVVSSSSL